MAPRVRQIDRDCDLVVALAIDGERAPRDVEGFGMPSFVPAEQSETSQRAAQQRRVAALLADPQRGGQRPIGGVESLEQRREVALTQIDLGEARRAPSSCAGERSASR